MVQVLIDGYDRHVSMMTAFRKQLIHPGIIRCRERNIVQNDGIPAFGMDASGASKLVLYKFYIDEAI